MYSTILLSIPLRYIDALIQIYSVDSEINDDTFIVVTYFLY